MCVDFMNQIMGKLARRIAAVVVICGAFSGCFSYPDPEPPPPPFKVDEVRAAAKSMSDGIVALPEVAETIGALNVRFDGVRNRTRFFTEMDIFGKMLMRELSMNASDRITFVAAGGESSVSDIDYLLKGESIGLTHASYDGIKDFIMVTMMLEEPLSHKIVWQQSFEFEVTTKIGIAYR